MSEISNYYQKYIKYKSKYLELQANTNLTGGAKKLKKTIADKNNKNKTNKYNKLKRMENNIIPTYPKEHLSEPWFTLISMGLKTVEGRKNKGKYKEMKVGDVIEWVNDDFKPRSIMTRVIGKNVYSTFKEYLETEGLENCLPGMPDITYGLSVYYKYFTPEDEATYGVVAIKLELVK